MDRTTAAALVSAVGLKTLDEKYAGALAAFSSVLVINAGAPEAPGGKQALEAWKSLAGVPGADTPRFLKALLEKDGGRLVAYYFLLGGLDLAHQRFFTRTPARMARFYELFRDAPETKASSGRRVHDDSLGAFFREVPLDEDGSVAFPGSPEIWMIANGRASSESRTAQLLKKARKTAAPDVEDEILLRLARTRYACRNEVQNFIAVVHIDERRSEPLDEASALSLAQNFAAYAPAYAYFEALTALQPRDYAQFFRFGEKLDAMPRPEQDAVLGEFCPLLELIRLAAQSRQLPQQKAADLFFDLCDRFTRAASIAEYTQSALALLARLAGDGAPDAGAAVRDLLIPAAAPVAFEFEGSRTLDPAAERRRAFDRVMSMQAIPPAQAALDLAKAAHELSSGAAAEPQLRILDASVAKLPKTELAKGVAKGAAGKLLAKQQPETVAAVAARIHRKAAQRKTNRKDFEKLEQELLTGLAPTVRLVLSGLVYAWYFRPGDLLIADDPLFVRKHRFIDLAEPKEAAFPRAELHTNDDPLRGAYLSGSFGGFAVQVARAALAGSKIQGSIAEAAWLETAAIRSAPWAVYHDSDQRLLGLMLRVAREWCVRAASAGEGRDALAEETLGLLSPARRLQALNAIEQGNWPAVWAALTSGDLYFLAQRYLARYPKDLWTSPVTAALRAELAAHPAESTGDALDVLGPVLPDLYGSDFPLLVPLAPYEEFERHVVLAPIAQRSAEFKIALARCLDGRAIPAAALETLAEPLGRRIWETTTVADGHDWRSLLAAYAKIGDAQIAEALPK